ncbi:hypothetical protein EV363DRAFT_1080823, partial [Boletus edulis]
ASQVDWVGSNWHISASEILSEEAWAIPNSLAWRPRRPWNSSASEILSEEASEDTTSNPVCFC